MPTPLRRSSRDFGSAIAAGACRPNAWLTPAFALVGLFALAGHARAQQVRPGYDMTNGTVRAIATAGDRIYLGGEFSRVGPVIGRGGSVSAHTGDLEADLRANDYVYGVAEDGRGGYFYSGLFTEVAGERRDRLAQIAEDGSLTSWAPSANNHVNSVLLRGNTLYVRGGFSAINGVPRNKLAAIDAVTGEVTPWNPYIGPPATTFVGPMVLHEGRLYTSLNTSPTPSHTLVSYDTVSGTDRLVGSAANGWITAIAIRDTTVYVGGQFTTMGGEPRQNFAVLDARTLELLPWNPRMPEPSVFVIDGSTLYVGNRYGGVYAIDLETHSQTSWSPDLDGDYVWALAVCGETVYVGGDFDEAQGELRTNCAAFDRVTGALEPWDPGPSGTVYALAANQDRVFVGGSMVSLGGARRANLAAIDATTGRVTAWDPGANAAVRALVADGSIVYVGGSFDSVGGRRRERLAAVDGSTGSVLDWDPRANGAVRAMLLEGERLYVGGSFTQVGGQARGRLAAIDVATGLPSAWSPRADSTVRALAKNDSLVFAGGSFTQMNGIARPLLAAIDAVTGTTGEWGGLATGSTPDVYALALRGPTLYVAGDFSWMGGELRDDLAAVDAATGMATPWRPFAHNTQYGLTVVDQGGTDLVYTGGVDRVAAFEGGTAAGPWAFHAQGDVYAVVHHGGSVFVGGTFDRIGVTERSGFAAVEDVTTNTLLSLFVAEATPGGIRLRWSFAEPRPTRSWIERATLQRGPWSPLPDDDGSGVAIDRNVAPGDAYYDRLNAQYGQGLTTFGPIRVVAGAMPSALDLVRVGPTPSAGPVHIDFTMAREGRLRLVVLDLEGRSVATLLSGVHAAGSYRAAWSGAGARGIAPPGVYFVSLEADGRRFVRRLVLRR